MEDSTVKMIIDGVTGIIGILGICFLEHTALNMGMNGTMLGLAMAAVGGIAGIKLKGYFDTLKGEKDES